MPSKAMSEARMREVIKEQVAASMDEFVANMNRGAGGDKAGGGGAGGGGAGSAGAGGAGPVVPEITGCTYITFMKCDPQPFKGTEEVDTGECDITRPAVFDELSTDEVSEGEKRKGEGDRGGRGDNRRDYNRRQNQRRANA
ncbi:hypothetical protein Tco_0939140 [Tanacetum coccineum]|uniref:Uncharacterized protein n=1 Tax=Tanacetum coccineum TaxID=301880 RepID=A0ABQ5DJ78_9ASTR